MLTYHTRVVYDRLMRTIWKFPLNGPLATQEQRVTVGESWQAVHVGPDPTGIPCVWVEHDPDESTTNLYLSVVGTGHPISPGADHLGSYVETPFVWHVYGRDGLQS